MSAAPSSSTSPQPRCCTGSMSDARLPLPIARGEVERRSGIARLRDHFSRIIRILADLSGYGSVKLVKRHAPTAEVPLELRSGPSAITQESHDGRQLGGDA